MTDETARQIDELEAMTVAELRERYREVYGEPSRSGNRRWLVRRIAWQLQALDEGDLTERARRRASELARDQDLRVRPPRGLEVRRPVRRTGLRTVSGAIVKRDGRVPMPGSVITREYKGTEHRVLVLEDGFEHDGQVYRSLSAVAHAITGSHWNGFHFFGLRKKQGGDG
ncbi:MAG: DUF2924 domain-containing protein [Phycisphaerales bacterium]|nr:DUF2924 domain-containing protein [Phycisphaerales bacterium]